MSRYFIFIVASLFVSLGIISGVAAYKNQSADSYSILTLSEREVFIPCKIGYVPTESCPDRTSILVAVRGNKDLDGKEIEISYKVSGGRFVRKGEDFEWDFADVEKPGVYVLKVEFVDFNGKKQTAVETITLRECDCPNDIYAPDSQSPKPTPTPAAKIEKIELDREEIIVPCAPGVRPKAGTACDDVSSIKVKTSIVNPQNENLTYHYTISGGRIVGRGASVSWDLSGVRAGTYTITAGIGDDSVVYSETQTKTIRVKDCICIFADACPVLEIAASSESVKAGETIIFTLNVSGGFDSEGTYNWTISQGEITEGQGTPKIKVKTAREAAGSSLTATVQISSDRIPGICQSTADQTVSITK